MPLYVAKALAKTSLLPGRRDVRVDTKPSIDICAHINTSRSLVDEGRYDMEKSRMKPCIGGS